ncbi:MAG TPA: 7-carboxy-7-deazaguanine synthase QueE [Methanothrix sp.]
MRLIEIFCSMQGEGPAMGRPATFVRLADCNLRCEGCDTDQKAVRIVALSSLWEEIKLLGPRVVITGGEPTLQMDELSKLITLLHGAGVEIHIETNGTNPISEEVLEKVHYAVVSPKRGSNFHLEYWAKKANVHLKFVLGKAAWCWTSEQLKVLVSHLDKERVWIMAYGTDQDMHGAREAWDLALRLGVNYSDRLHIRLRAR